MFHKAKTEAERQKIFDEYFLNLLKKKQNIKRHQKIIDNSSLNFDPINQDKSSRGVFNSFVDSLVIKNFLIEQLYTRLKLNKNVVQSFVNKLNSNDILIMNKTLNEYIQYIKDNYQNANDYILTNSFNELKKNYNVKELQQKNKEIITQNQEETSDTLQNAIPRDTLEEAEDEEAEGDEEPKGAEEKEKKVKSKKKKEDREATILEDEEEKLKAFFQNTTEEIKNLPEKKQILNYFNQQFGLQNVKLKSNKDINEYFIKTSKKLIDDEPEEMKEQMRNDIEDAIQKGFFQVKGKAFVNKYKGLFVVQNKISGNGYGTLKNKNDDKYLKLGKYKANKEKLLGGKLQIRSENENQVNNVKSQMISKNIRDILLKINKKEIINYSDVDKLDENEKNHLYNIGKKLHITELFEIPSTLKNQEEKLKDEFFKLRGSIMAGNNSPEILKKFKMILIKMKNNKMISLSEFNEILNIFLEMDY
jgi:hypothetical protein